MIPTKLVALLAAFGVMVVHSEPAPLPGYEVEELVWEVEHTPGKPPAKLRGTIEEIHDQILDINPDFKPHEEDTSPAVKRGDGADALANLSKRKYQVICNHFPQTDKEKVELGIEYLRKVKGRPWLGPGPGKCIRVSCGYDAAIWWCNDNKEMKILPSFINIAQGASVVLEQCTVGGKNVLGMDRSAWMRIVSGQDFHQDLWNVIVRQTRC